MKGCARFAHFPGEFLEVAGLRVYHKHPQTTEGVMRSSTLTRSNGKTRGPTANGTGKQALVAW